MANVLVLGGTSWLGGEIAKTAVARGHNVTCLARGGAGDVPAGATFVRADRENPNAYAGVLHERWDHVFDVSWQPRFVRAAVESLGSVTSHWTYVSSVSAYADLEVGGDEDTPLHEPLDADTATLEDYGPAKVRCEQIVQTLPHTLVARAGLLVGPGDRSDRFGYWVSRFAAHDVEPWAGPRSLPLWIPGHGGIGSQSDARIVGTGINRRPWTEVLGDTLEYERSLGLGRERRAGLPRAEELMLIKQVRDR